MDLQTVTIILFILRSFWLSFLKNSLSNPCRCKSVSYGFMYLCMFVWENPPFLIAIFDKSPLPNPIYGEEFDSKFCIFTNDPQRDFKNKVKSLHIPCISRVIGNSKIDKKFPTAQAKQKLLHSYDLFFVDHSIYDIVKKTTGKIFVERKK